MELLYDFHIHSCLSPCGADEMTPKTIVECALAKELNCIALTDHNTIGNCAAVLKYAENTALTVLPGMELQTAEEIHVICLFATLNDALHFGDYVKQKLPPIENATDIFGHQTQVLPDGTEKEETQMLLISSEIPLYGLYELVASFGGVAIPAHIDRDAFSVKSAFGILNKEMGFPLVEVFCDPTLANDAGIPYIQSSDAHNIDRFFDSEYHALEADDNTPIAIINSLKKHK